MTHIVVSELPDHKVQEWRLQPAKTRKPIVLPSWITDSIAAGQLRPWRAYLLPRLADRSQSTLLDGSSGAASTSQQPAQRQLQAPAHQQSGLTALAAGGRAEAYLPNDCAQAITSSTKSDPDFVRKYFSTSILSANHLRFSLKPIQSSRAHVHTVVLLNR
eukprot:SAG31_NODE_1740_length_7394_cov_7.518849_8_plen_160_part_00